MVRFSHTVFALPFALASALAAAGGWPDAMTAVWILVCMVSARTAAMTFNRIADRDLDKLNPRTMDRHLPSGKVSLIEALALWAVSSVLFVFGAWMLNPLAFILSFPALAVICGYSLFKRFSSLCHFVLGLSLGIAPAGAWIAVRGTLDLPPVFLSIAVMLWVAGFDTLYALMDEDFDRERGLHSLAVRLGRRGALRAAFASHALSIVFLFLFGWSAGLGAVYYAGCAAYAVLILYEHSLVSPDDITRVNMAFFNVNGVISIGLFVFTWIDIAAR